jgi:hypothetical protein
VISVEGACRYSDREAGVVDHGITSRIPLFPGDRESAIGVAAAGLAISSSLDVGAWGVLTRRDLDSRLRVDDDADWR